jgi:hypothetical protein
MYLRPQAGQDSLLTMDGEGDRAQMKRRSSPHESHSMNAKLNSATQAAQPIECSAPGSRHSYSSRSTLPQQGHSIDNDDMAGKRRISMRIPESFVTASSGGLPRGFAQVVRFAVWTATLAYK